MYRQAYHLSPLGQQRPNFVRLTIEPAARISRPSPLLRGYHNHSDKPVKHILEEISDYSAAHQVLVFDSQIDSPYTNLAIENYLLKRSHLTSKILLFYTNRPSVVIGRNQNPWLECNLKRLSDHSLQGFDLVRRRSGGGTVVHDAGNLNFSFIVPNDKQFTRDKHGQLVVEALKSPGVFETHEKFRSYQNVRINDRHDIVMNSPVEDQVKEYKVSGSAYKLTKGRALHHGTILHSSPHVSDTEKDNYGLGHKRSTFSSLLSSSAGSFIDAKGVGSVRSPVHNLFEIDNDELRRSIRDSIIQAVVQRLRVAYEAPEVQSCPIHETDIAFIDEIREDKRELQTLDWRFCQTPSFTYKSPQNLDVQLEFEVKQGVIKDGSIDHGMLQDNVFGRLKGRKLHEIKSWDDMLSQSSSTDMPLLLSHLDDVFPDVANLEISGDEMDSSSKVPIEADQTYVLRENRRAREVEKAGENTIVVQ